VIINGSSSSSVPGSSSRGPSISSEPEIDSLDSLDSSVQTQSLKPSNGAARVAPKSSLPEPAPKATIGDDPDLDTYSSQSYKPKSTTKAPAATPKTGGTGVKGPDLQGPGGSSSLDKGVKATSATGRVKKISARDRLQPFLSAEANDDLFYPNKADRPWQFVVLHHSANPEGNYDQIDGEHRKILGYDGCGYHFVIGNGTGSEDGQIEVSQRWVNQKHGVHCRNAKNAQADEYGIGICLVGDLDKEPPTPRQLAAARALISYLQSRYAIEQRNVETHSHLAAKPTVCPGRYFSTDDLLSTSPKAASRQTRRDASTAWRVEGSSRVESR
jgi:hypothetical protein